jgi:hypothetical protein
MSADNGSKEAAVTHPLWKLPDIMEIKIKLIPYQPPKLRHFKSYLSRYSKAIEFLVKTNGPIPIRALSPVLYVGNVPVTESGRVKENVLRFLAFELAQLKDGEAISLGWIGQTKDTRIQTKFQYKTPETDNKQSRSG